LIRAQVLRGAGQRADSPSAEDSAHGRASFRPRTVFELLAQAEGKKGSEKRKREKKKRIERLNKATSVPGTARGECDCKKQACRADT